MCLLRSILHPLHVSDASWILRPVHVCARAREKERKTDVVCSMRTRQSAKSPRVQKERIVCAPWSRRFDQWEQRDVGSPLHRRRDRASSPPPVPVSGSTHILLSMFLRTVDRALLRHQPPLQLSIFLQRSRKGFLWEGPRLETTYEPLRSYVSST